MRSRGSHRAAVHTSLTSQLHGPAGAAHARRHARLLRAMVRTIAPDISFLNAALKRRTIAGAVALVADRSADVLWQHACGCSDATSSLPMRTDALFWAASGLSKPLTAAAAMMLVGCRRARA